MWHSLDQGASSQGLPEAFGGRSDWCPFKGEQTKSGRMNRAIFGRVMLKGRAENIGNNGYKILEPELIFCWLLALFCYDKIKNNMLGMLIRGPT